jgi:hypothetical protein
MKWEFRLRRQLRQQRLRFLQIERVEPFGEPAVNRSEQFASLLRSNALVGKHYEQLQRRRAEETTPLKNGSPSREKLKLPRVPR